MLLLNYSDEDKNLKNLNFKHKRSLKSNLKLIANTKITSHLISTEKFDKGSILVEEQKPVHGVYFIINGNVKIFNTGINQKKQTLRLLSNSDIVGLSSLNSPYYWASAIVVDNVEAYFINHKNLKTILKSNNKICILFLHELSLRLRHYEIRQKHLSLLPASERIIDAILLTAYKFGKIIGEGEIQISTCTSRKDLAEFANTSVEQSIRTLKILKEKNYISINGKSIIIRKKEELIAQLKQYYDSEKLLDKFNFCYPDPIY
ncbi:MAG: Crp/Fnr family transcriptional regulator [Lutibacter sp.]|nr:Crp/Fnr family transcriptional regulator [Lutibacter sp.]